MKKKVTIIISANYNEHRNLRTNEEISNRIKDVLVTNGNPNKESIDSVIVEDIPAPKVKVFSKPECIFQYCPHPEVCRENGCQCKKGR